ncbi:MAG: hypothetical protein KDD36_14450 [Flavobacteriales bacterium]|nr:hypothetical protein [Flavobacteriales bacterium]
MKKLISLLLICLGSLWAFAQSEVELTIQLFTPDLIGQVTVDQEPFITWMGTVTNTIEANLKEEEGDKEVIVVVSVHRDKAPSISVGARPKLSKGGMKKLTDALANLAEQHTKFTDYSFAVMAKVNKGCDQELEFEPAISYPQKTEMEAFKKLEPADKIKEISIWMKEEVIPIVAYYENRAEDQFEGVRSMGEILKQQKYLKARVEDLTENNPDYWRATMEMSQGNQIIPFTKACMYLADGAFDKANHLLFVIRFFSDNESLPALFLDEISAKMEVVNDEITSAINQGIALHDQGKYKEAVSHYNKLLKVFPNSAWLNYEHYFSGAAQMKDEDKQNDAWTASKKVIYTCDPLYPVNVRASTGKEGYLLFRRQEINSLFKKKEDLKSDFVKYADIALELEDYGFAAQLYWLILSYFAKEDYDNRNILAHYLYCLDKLGDTESVKNFKGDFPEEFAKVEAERRRVMEESPTYKAFGKPE